VINWCDANPQNPVYFTFVQKITLTNAVPPVVVAGCGNRTINSLDNDCEEYVEHSITATDDCTPSELLKYTWAYDRNNDGTIDQTGTGNFYGKVYPAGKHKMTFTVKDGCENATTCSYIFTVKDNKPPTPICNTSVTWVLDENGKATIWASDFDLKSADLCDGSLLKYSFTADGLQPSKSFTCADVPNGVSATIPLKMYVIDSDGNSEFCDVKLVLQDSPTKNACPNTGNLTATISGKVANKIEEGFSEIEVVLENKNESTFSQKMTTVEGKFTFEEVPLLNGYMVNPVKKDDILNGVSTLDLVLIQRHILGAKSLENPYDIIAADINKDKKISAADLVSLRKVILGVENNFTSNNPWRFVPTSHSFADPKFPHDFPQGVDLFELTADVENLNFTAVKTGDVNGSASYNVRQSLNVESRTAPIVFVSNNKTFSKNQTVSIDLKVSDYVNIAGMQMALRYDASKLEFANITSSKLNVNTDNHYANDGMLKISIDQQANVEALEGDEIMTITFKAKAEGESNAIQLEEGDFANELYDNEFNSRSIKFEWLDSTDGRFENTIKNHPNPFSDFTALQFSTTDEGISTLKVMDATGKLIYKNQDQFVKGANKIIVKKEHLNSHSGIYFYQLEINGKIHTGTMILSE
jgi:Cohesin domain/Dockerin type I domain